MKKSRRPLFFVTVALILVFAYLSIVGVYTYFGDNRTSYIKGMGDIRWGIDISGGVEAIFTPNPDDIDPEDITARNMRDARNILEHRLNSARITDYEIFIDSQNHHIIVRFPWQRDEADFDPARAVEELGAMAVLTFNEGDGETRGPVILQGARDVSNASSGIDPENPGQVIVNLNLTASGRRRFAEATTRLVGQPITVWMDDVPISTANVNEAITGGRATISGGFDSESARVLADTINAGSLPFGLTVDDARLSVISPFLGERSLDVMLMAGLIAFALVVIIMLVIYKVQGLVAIFSLIFQIAAIFAAVSGFFPFAPSFTLTIPGIAGIVIAIGKGVDANIINSERIVDELNSGRTIDGAIKSGYKRGWGAIIDSCITSVVVSIILMGAFGPPGTPAYFLVSPLMFMFPASITGAVYSFGFTLMLGTVLNLFAGFWLSRFMIKNVASFKSVRKPSLLGGRKDAESV